MLLWRIRLAPDGLSVGLWWNLFLALVPLMAASAFGSASLKAQSRGRAVAMCLWFGLWLLFLPNAPYILTDLIHLRPHPVVPQWLMLAMLLSCAGTGTLFGYLSLLNVQAAVARLYGAVAGWGVAFAALMLCGFGIYLGRFLRWNSWDALTRPAKLFHAIIAQFIDAGPHPNPLSVSIVYGVGLFIGYLALRVVAAANET